MGDGRQSENGRHNLDYFRGTSNPWNMASPHYQVKEPNALVMNKKIMSIIAERDAAIQDRNLALSEKIGALAARDEALRKRDEAIAQRDSALMERDNAVAAFQIHNSPASFPLGSGIQRKNKRLTKTLDHVPFVNQGPSATEDRNITDAFPFTAIASEAAKIQHRKQKNTKGGSSKSQRLTRKKVGEDLNRQAASGGIKYRTDCDARDVGFNLLDFDESTMQVPICTCTGIGRRCYKWGNRGWQSSCCTITMSMYPLPHLPNKRHARMGGRKMSGSVFVRLLGRLAAEGHDLSAPVDLKDHWARHGTNRCITIR